MAGTAPLRKEEGITRRDGARRGEESHRRGKEGVGALKPARILFVAFLLASFLVSSGCGRKTPPSLSKKSFDVGILDLKGEWSNGFVVLKGRIGSPGRAGEIAGCRVSYAPFLPAESPCETCPMEFVSSEGFGPEVVVDQEFLCRVPAKQRGYVYFFKVNLIGPDGVLGPPSDQVRVMIP